MYIPFGCDDTVVVDVGVEMVNDCTVIVDRTTSSDRAMIKHLRCSRNMIVMLIVIIFCVISTNLWLLIVLEGGY